MKFKKRKFLYLLSIILLFYIFFVFIEREMALKDPKSCLAKKNKLLQEVKRQPHVVGWTMPHCDIFGKWRAQQQNDSGYRWCVTAEGETIPGTFSREQPKQCNVNTLENMYIVIMDTLL